MAKPRYIKMKATSLKDAFIEKFESLVLSGEYGTGDRLPPERDLAEQYKISRPVIHDGLVDLAAKGIVRVVPRKGTYVNDYRKEGSIAFLESIVRYGGGKISPQIFDSFLETRILFECETARLAALRASQASIDEIANILAEEKNTPLNDCDAVSEVDFRFHYAIACGSENSIYIMLINTFKKIYMTTLKEFYRNSSSIESLFKLHHDLYQAIAGRQPEQAAAIMRNILVSAEAELRHILTSTDNAIL